MIAQYMSQMTEISWLAMGIILIFSQVIIRTDLLIWFGFSAILIAGLLYTEVLVGWQVQLIIFFGTAILSLIIWRVLFRKKSKTNKVK